MIHKDVYYCNGIPKVRVTFTLPDSLWADSVYLVGDFNKWHHSSHPMQHKRDGRWELILTLDSGRAYQFRYLINGQDWINDDAADAYVRNYYGSDNFVVVTDLEFKKYCD